MKKTKQIKSIKINKECSKKKLDEMALVLRSAVEGDFKKNIKIFNKKDEYSKLLGAIDLAVSELKKINKAGGKDREGNSQFKELFNNMKSGVAIYESVEGGIDFIFKDLNKSGERICMIKKGDVIGEKLSDVFPGVIKLGLLKVLQKVKKTGKPVFIPSTFYQDKRIEQWVENFVFKLSTGEIVVIYNDRTKEKQEEGKTKKSEKQYKDIFEMSPEAIIVFDNKGKLLDLNERVYDWLGYNREKIMGMNILKLPFFSTRSKIIVAKKFTQRILGKNVPPYELEFISKKGKRVTGLINATPIRDEKGNIIQDLVMITDVTDKKKADEAVRNLATIVETANIVIVSKDLGGVITSWNKGAENIYGYKADEVIGEKISIIASKDKRKELDDLFLKLRRNKKVKMIEVEQITKSGKKVTVELSVSLIKNNAGEIVGYSAIGRDITELKTAANKVKESEGKYKKLFDNMDSGFIHLEAIYNKEGKLVDSRYLDINSAYEKIIKIKKEKALGKAVSKLMSSTNQSWFDRFSDVIKKNKKINFEMYYEYTKKYYYVSSFKTSNDSYVVIFQDITRIKESENQIKESENRFFDIALSSADFIWEVDNTGRYIFISGKVEEILGYESEELIGKTPFEIMTEAEQERVGKIFHKLSSKKKSIVGLENWSIKKNGERVFLLTNGVPVIGEKGELKGYRGVDTDITKRKRDEHILAQRSKILSVLSSVSKKFLQQGITDKSINYFIESLGKALNVDRVYIFKKHIGGKEELLVSQQEEWFAFGVSPQIDNKEMQDLNLQKSGLKRWQEHFLKDMIIKGVVRKLPKIERGLLKKQEIKAILIVPIFVDKKWWGFIGFDDCKNEKEWSSVEIESLRIAVNIYGAALERDGTEKDSSEQFDELQKMNSLMVDRELKMIELKKEIRILNSKLKK